MPTRLYLVFFRRSRAANSKVSGGILPKFESIQAFIVVLVTCKNHYENMSMQYTAIIHGSKIENFYIKNDNFLIFAHNIDCGYTLEPPQ